MSIIFSSGVIPAVIALADELYSGPHTLKNPDAYLWSVLAQRGFDELRRDYGGQRVMSKRMFERVGLCCMKA